MSYNLQRLVFPLSIAVLIVSSLLFLRFGLGFNLNLTPSINGTLVRETPLNGKIEKGDYVLVCPDDNFPKINLVRSHADRGPCGGVSPLFKRVIALGGDYVEIDSTGISVNGRHIASSAPILADHANFKGVIQEGYVVLSGDHQGSLDSRYFGCLNSRYIKSGVAIIF